MSNVLIVSYTPRTDSNSRKLLDSFLSALPESAEIDHHDLLKDPVTQLSGASIDALLKRNFANLTLTEEELSAVSDVDSCMQRLLNADIVVFAFPFYNFCVPAAIKAWLDAVIQKDRTFEVTEEGAYAGLCQNKKALILMSSGGDYSQEPFKSMNFATPLMKQCLGFLGIQCHAISAFGIDQNPDRAGDIVVEAQRKVVDFVAKLR